MHTIKDDIIDFMEKNNSRRITEKEMDEFIDSIDLVAFKKENVDFREFFKGGALLKENKENLNEIRKKENIDFREFFKGGAFLRENKENLNEIRKNINYHVIKPINAKKEEISILDLDLENLIYTMRNSNTVISEPNFSYYLDEIELKLNDVIKREMLYKKVINKFDEGKIEFKVNEEMINLTVAEASLIFLKKQIDAEKIEKGVKTLNLYNYPEIFNKR